MQSPYCFIFRVTDGKLRELTEYFDTELVTQAFEGTGGSVPDRALMAPPMGLEERVVVSGVGFNAATPELQEAVRALSLDLSFALHLANFALSLMRGPVDPSIY